MIEDGSQVGGVFQYILSQCTDMDRSLNDWLSFGIPDQFIEHGAISKLQEEIDLPHIRLKKDCGQF